MKYGIPSKRNWMLSTNRRTMKTMLPPKWIKQRRLKRRMPYDIIK
jgi:hypothetical protein